jgi:heat-inducible transcriptional repressor
VRAVKKGPDISDLGQDFDLSERERKILRLVVQSFIEMAGPVGSRFLSRRYPLGLSPASIRNTMSDLEERGLLDHPYTSAGRVPTELGYRTFVDQLMDMQDLSPREKHLLRAELDRILGDTSDLYRESSRLLGRLSNLLGVVLSPKLSTGVLERMEVVPLSSTRVMFVISVRGGLVKTIVLELDIGERREEIDQVVAILNDRLAGLTLEEIRRTFPSRVRDLHDDRSGLVRLVLDKSAQVFSDPAESRRVNVAGTQNIVSQPEFKEPADLRNLIDLLENEDFVVQLMEEQRPELPGVGRAFITIGREHADEKAEKYSIVTARYQLGDTVGTVGVIGPTRMDYSRVVSLVESMASLLGGGEGDDR